MKIVQINSVCGVGSTGRIAIDIAEASEKRGHICYIAYGHGNTTYPLSYKIGNKLGHLFHNVVFTRLLGLHGYGSVLTTYRFTKWLDQIRPDVIHIHNIHANYLNYRILFNHIIKRDIPVVFTLHDCFNFTGKCTHYTAAGCKKWQAECGHCPIYRSTGVPSMIFDHSTRIFHEKKALYAQIPHFHVVAISQWLKAEAEKSILAGNGHVVDYIYNWVDHDTFRPASDEEKMALSKEYELRADRKYLISVSQEWDKNTIRYQDAKKLSEMLPEKYSLILVGRLAKGTVSPKGVIHIPYISDRHSLSIVFSIAEAYVHFSIEDTFGLVIAEAMACGTIPISYNSTACAEVPGGFGIVVEPRDVAGIIHALPLLDEKKRYSCEMVEYVKTNYDKRTNTNKYVDIYESFLNNGYNNE